MEYLGIKNLLQKFQKHLSGKKDTEENTQSVIKEVAGLDIPIENISFKNKKIVLAVRSLIKTEVTMKKQKILSILKERGFNVEDIF